MTTLFRRLLPAGVLSSEADPEPFRAARLPAPERAAVARAVERRRREYAAGRTLARELLGRLGVDPRFHLLAGEDRAPVWPEGVRGSITHAPGRVAVAVAAADAIPLLGIDLELDRPLEEESLEIVCTTRELARLQDLPAVARGTQAKLLFSIKEAAYKALYPLCRTVLEFHDLEVEFDGARGFIARLQRQVEPLPAGTAVEGRWRRTGGYLASAVAMSSTARSSLR